MVLGVVSSCLPTYSYFPFLVIYKIQNQVDCLLDGEFVGLNQSLESLFTLFNINGLHLNLSFKFY